MIVVNNSPVTSTIKSADTKLFSTEQVYFPLSLIKTLNIMRVLVDVGSSVDVNSLMDILIESLSISLSRLHSKVTEGLATTLHSMMRICCSSGVAVFPLISTLLAGTTD